MRRPFIIGTRTATRVFLDRMTPEQIDRMLRDINTPVPLTLAESKALMAPAKAKVVS